jgi:single-strand DNA-binding protein
LVGRLGKDPELKYTNSNKAVCKLSVATSLIYKDASGQRHEDTEWHMVEAWDAAAENCAKYLAKGRLVAVQGRIKTESYDKGGVKVYATKIVANTVSFLDSDGGAKAQRPAGPKPQGGPAPAPAGADDDMPF